MYGIPNMKLDKKIVERRVKLMEAEGVTFVTGADVGRDRRCEATACEENDAVVLACGASNPRDLPVPGRDAGERLLRGGLPEGHDEEPAQFQPRADGLFISAKDKNVVVVGGGDTGNDCVGTSIRHGAKPPSPRSRCCPARRKSAWKTTPGPSGPAS